MNNLSKLEKFLHDNRRLFDEEPPMGHFERLKQKMTDKPTRIISWRASLSIAASIAILATVGIVWLNPAKEHETLVVCEDTGDMKFCYLERMNVVAEKIEMLVMDFDVWDRQEVMNDVQSIIETVNSDFESELPEELPEDLMNAILSDFYRQNLEGLEMIHHTIESEINVIVNLRMNI